MINIKVTDIGEYISQDSCAVKFKLRSDQNTENKFPYYREVRKPIDPILNAAGREAENKLSRILQDKGIMKLPYNKSSPIEGRSTTWNYFLKYLAEAKENTNVFMREVEISSESGEFYLHGKMDFVLLMWSDQPIIRILECKSSRKDKTYHRVQLAAYKMMMQEKLSEGVIISGKTYKPVIECSVIRAEGRCNIFDPIDTPALNLDNEVLDLIELTSSTGPLCSIYNSDLNDLDYALDNKCSICSHSPICAVESVRNERIEILGLPLSDNKALKNAGIRTLNELISSDADRLDVCRYDPAMLKINAEAKLAGIKLTKESYPVQSYKGVLPALPYHKQDNGDLIRVYLDVEWDLLEDRILGVAAHITDSDKFLYLKKNFNSGKSVEEPVPLECCEDKTSVSGMKAEEIVSIMSDSWSSSNEENDLKERELLEDFFKSLSSSILQISDGERPLHFYVWSDQDMRHLIDGCKRAGGDILGNLTELLGCRANCTHDLEQVIYSSLENEMKRRMAIGRMSSSLEAITFFRWYRWDFHWTRMIGTESVNFKKLFHNDIFDLAVSLGDSDGHMSRKNPGKYYEIRVSSNSSISPSYWYVMWGIDDFTDIEGIESSTTSYIPGGKKECIEAFMIAKCQALRWIDDRLMPQKLPSGKMMPTLIPQKPALPLNELSSIQKILSKRNRIRDACLDFLRLDHKINEVEWLAENSQPVQQRMVEGLCIPLCNMQFSDDNKFFTAEIDFESYHLDKEKFFEMCEFSKDSFVRVLPCYGSSYELRKGITAIISSLDFSTGHIEADIMGGRPSNFIMSSRCDNFDNTDRGLVVSSLSDFTKDKVSKWLKDMHSPIFEWFDPIAPAVPEKPTSGANELAIEILQNASHGDLDDSQLNACVDGLDTRVQLLFGPPGTGKTNTMSYAVLLRMLMSRDNSVFLISANTHTAIDELLQRINLNLNNFSLAAEASGMKFDLPNIIRLTDATPNEGEMHSKDYHAASEFMSQGRTAFCGTVNQILKLAKEMQDKDSFLADSLIIDEASMMVFPNFLALATLLDVDGDIMLAGDILQLSPITSYAWDTEQREQIEKLKPYQSAYAAIQSICTEKSHAVRQSLLNITYRMNSECTSLVSEIYRKEGITLQTSSDVKCIKPKIKSLADIWQGYGIYLIVHNENKSKKYNPFEVSLIQEILNARTEDDVAVITPHRAQKAAISKISDVTVDTVERFQGGQRDTIIVSGTQSDAMEISGNAEFILNLNRTNVIFSRAKNRLLVVCSKNLLDSIPSDAEEYENALLWKRLRFLCSETAYILRYKGYDVEVKIPPLF